MVSDIFLYLVEAMTISTQTYQNFYFSGNIPSEKKVCGEKKCMNYYPFGLKHKGYNNVVSSNGNSVAQKKKFAGEEFEDELGKNTVAFQWRDYDPALGRFNKIDRFAEKYGNHSPYAFTKNNPIRFREIAGDSLWISYKGNNILYENGNLLNSDGTNYTGEGVTVKKNGEIKLTGFLKKSVAALDKLSSKKAGNATVDELQSSSDNYTIVESTNGNKYAPSSNEIKFDPSSKQGGLNLKGKRKRPTFVGLGHELAHAVDDDRGTLDLTVDPSFGFRNAEKYATHIENQIRAEHGISLRSHYGINTMGAGVGPLLINGTPESRYYRGYYYGGVNTTSSLTRAPLTRIPANIQLVTPTINTQQ